MLLPQAACVRGERLPASLWRSRKPEQVRSTVKMWKNTQRRNWKKKRTARLAMVCLGWRRTLLGHLLQRDGATNFMSRTLWSFGDSSTTFQEPGSWLEQCFTIWDKIDKFLTMINTGVFVTKVKVLFENALRTTGIGVAGVIWCVHGRQAMINT